MSDTRTEIRSDAAGISRPLVSVVVIFYNCDGFLAEAIDSILAQTYDNWELLLCDDGSTDGGTDRAKQYAARFPGKVRHLEHPGHSNKGMSATRNLGISQARGDLVTFLDGDDVYLPERLARHVEVFGRFPQAEVVQSPRELWHSWRSESGPPDTLDALPPVELGKPIAPPELLVLMLDSEGTTAPGMCGTTVKRQRLQAVGGMEDRFRGLYEDQVLFAKLYLESITVILGEPLSRYRLNPKSITHTSRISSHQQAKLGFVTWLEAYLRERNATDARVWQALSRTSWIFRHPLIGKAQLVALTVLARAKWLARAVLPAAATKRLMSWWGRSTRSLAVARSANARQR